MPPKATTAEIRIKKVGPNGNPFAEILIDNSVSSDQLGKIVQAVTRDKDLLKKLGLKACPGCKSGFDINFRDRFEHVLTVDVR
jgi:hypothetical protein